MSYRTDAIAKQFQEWLNRYAPPQFMKGDQKAMQAEFNALLRMVVKYAPSDDWEGWINRMLDQLSMQMKTRAWPTQNELGSACVNTRKSMAKPDSDGPRDSDTVTAEAMAKGEAVGEGWLWGNNAVRLLRRNLVTPDVIQRYRRGLFEAMKEVWGEAEAKAQMSARELLHADAMRTEGERMRRDFHVPGKRFPPEAAE